jgi:hypothetical protein
MTVNVAMQMAAAMAAGKDRNVITATTEALPAGMTAATIVVATATIAAPRN